MACRCAQTSSYLGGCRLLRTIAGVADGLQKTSNRRGVTNFLRWPRTSKKRLEMKKILVMGGTGAMGKYLVPMLADDSSYQVFVTSRSARQSNFGNLIYLKGNAKDLPWIKTIFETFDFDVVFDFMMYGGGEFQERSQLFLENCRHYFYFSTYRALGEDTVLTENSPVKPDALLQHPEYELDRYGIRKAQEEKVLHESGKNNYTIIRPSMTFSSNRFQYFSGDNFDVIRAAKRVPTLLPESAVNSITNLTYGKNVAKMLKALVDKPAAMGQTFHAVTKSMTWGEIGEAFKKVFGMTYQVVPDSQYLELIDLEDGRIFDRLRRRNISNKKILSTTGLSDADFGTLEDNLREAWAESDQDRYRTSRASAGAHARFDYITKSQINLGSLDDKSKREYYLSKQSLSDRIKLGDFWIRPNPSYWEISPSSSSGGGALIRRNEKAAVSNAWLNFRNLDYLLSLKKGDTYQISINIISDRTAEINPFIHFFGRSILRLNRVYISSGYNKIDISFKAVNPLYSDFSITATEIDYGSIGEISRLALSRF